MVGTDQAGLCHFQLPHGIGRLAVRLFSVPLPVSTNAMDRAREAGRPAGPLLVVRLGRNSSCHLVLDITFPPFRMIAPLAKFIDWSVLQIGGAMLPWRETVNERDLKLEQAIQFLNGPDFIPAESQPAQLDFISDASGGRFRFPTPRPCEFAENNVVHGRLYRCADAWQKRPVIVSLHGGGDFPGSKFGFHLFAHRCNRAGFNAITLELPYYFQRRPRQYGPLNNLCQYVPLISRDYLQMAKTYAQTVDEIRSLSGWLLAEGCPAVALVGVSLGAYLAGLTGCSDARLAAIVMIMPAARMGLLSLQLERVVGRRVRETLLRRRAACEELDRTPLSLTLARPAISKENVLLIEGIHDLLATSSPIELWQSWGQPEIWRLPHGHISTALTALMPGLTGRVLLWLSPRLVALAVQRDQNDAAR
jgi:pimeloyl-ACP methyl ester carboxylesterase